MTLPNITIQLPIKRLTQREIEIITFTAYGKTRDEVSKILSISDRTVQEHLEHVYEKLNATNKTHAATIAVTLGLITPYRTEMAELYHVDQFKGIRQMADTKGRKKSISKGD